MAYDFRITRRVEFNETDLAGIVHFTHFFRYMESAEHAFYRSLGFSVILPRFNPPVGLPRVHASCDYRRPLKFEDVFEMHLVVLEKKARTLTYEVRFRRLAPEPMEDIATGRLTVVCAAKLPDGRMQAVPFPAEVFDAIQPAPAEVLTHRKS